jgi:hypothetical protein
MVGSAPARNRGGTGDGLSEDDWWDLHSSAHIRSHELRGGAPLPRKLLRLGVRYADGRKATTIEQRPRGTRGPR